MRVHACMHARTHATCTSTCPAAPLATSLADKGWCRRSVVVQAVGPSGASNLEKVPGREDYASDEEGALEWGKASSL